MLALRAENLTQRREEMGNMGAIIVRFSLASADISTNRELQIPSPVMGLQG